MKHISGARFWQEPDLSMERYGYSLGGGNVKNLLQL